MAANDHARKWEHVLTPAQKEKLCEDTLQEKKYAGFLEWSKIPGSVRKAFIDYSF
jgi:hypothetical protein